MDMSESMDLILKEIQSLRSETNARFDQIDERFEAVDKRFDAVDTRLDIVDARLDQHESMIQQLIALSGTAIQSVQQLREEFLDERQLNQSRHESVVSELSSLRADIEFTYEKTSRNELELHRLQHRQSS
jgi:hypothetical protein